MYTDSREVDWEVIIPGQETTYNKREKIPQNKKTKNAPTYKLKMIVKPVI